MDLHFSLFYWTGMTSKDFLIWSREVAAWKIALNFDLLLKVINCVFFEHLKQQKSVRRECSSSLIPDKNSGSYLLVSVRRGGDTDLEFHKIYRIGSLSGDNSLISNFVSNSGKQKDSNNLTLTFSMREYILPCYLRDNISRGVKLMGKF